MLAVNAVIPGAEGFRTGMRVRLEKGCVTAIGADVTPLAGERVVDLAGDYLLPGFVDVHIHAHAGHDAMAGEDALRAMCRSLYQAGVAGFLPTTMSAAEMDTRRAVEAIRAVMNRPEPRGARVLGAHLEAPFLNPEKAGAQRTEYLQNPDWVALVTLTGGDVSAVRTVTIAPELPGAEDFTRMALRHGITVSLGHSAATAEQAHAAADWGANRVTHTCNAQSPLHHRQPGLPGAALTDERLWAEFIPDGVHLHGDMVRLMTRCKGANRAVAITDAMEAAGLPDGQYQLGGQAVTVQGGEARLADGTLAGSVLTMVQALHNLIHVFGTVPLDAVQMCTTTPAECIGEGVLGRMCPGSPVPLTRWGRFWEFIGIIDEDTEA